MTPHSTPYSSAVLYAPALYRPVPTNDQPATIETSSILHALLLFIEQPNNVSVCAARPDTQVGHHRTSLGILTQHQYVCCSLNSSIYDSATPKITPEQSCTHSLRVSITQHTCHTVAYGVRVTRYIQCSTTFSRDHGSQSPEGRPRLG